MHTYKHAAHCRLANDMGASERAAAWQAKTKKPSKKPVIH